MTRDTRSDRALRAAIDNNTAAYKTNGNRDRQARDRGAVHTGDPNYGFNQVDAQRQFARNATAARAEAARRARTN